MTADTVRVAVTRAFGAANRQRLLRELQPVEACIQLVGKPGSKNAVYNAHDLHWERLRQCLVLEDVRRGLPAF